MTGNDVGGGTSTRETNTTARLAGCAMAAISGAFLLRSGTMQGPTNPGTYANLVAAMALCVGCYLIATNPLPPSPVTRPGTDGDRTIPLDAPPSDATAPRSAMGSVIDGFLWACLVLGVLVAGAVGFVVYVLMNCRCRLG